MSFIVVVFPKKKEKGKNEKINQIGLIKSRMIDFELKNYNVNQFKSEKL